MKINEIVQDGGLNAIGKGLADIAAPGAVEKYQATKNSQAINQQKDTVNINGRTYKLVGQLGNQNWAEVTPQGSTTLVPTNIQNQLDQLSGRVAPTKKGKSSIVVPPYRKPRSTTTYPTQQSAPQQQTTPSGIIIPAGARTAPAQQS
jgi:delta 1-pyrroline-5-carboxylate dehydrogenase